MCVLLYNPTFFDDLVGLKWGRKAVFTRIPIRHSLSNPRNLDWGGWPDRLGWGGMLAWGGPRRPATPPPTNFIWPGPPNQFYLATSSQPIPHGSQRRNSLKDVRFCISGLSEVFIFDRFYKVFRHGGMPCGL